MGRRPFSWVIMVSIRRSRFPMITFTAPLAQGTFWLVLPTLPFFLALPVLLRQGLGFWPAMTAACLATVALYLLAVWLLPKFGVSLATMVC